MVDAVADADPAPSEAQNYFDMLGETPGTLLTRLVAQWWCADSTAERVAGLLGADLVIPLLSGVTSRLPTTSCGCHLGRRRHPLSTCLNAMSRGGELTAEMSVMVMPQAQRVVHSFLMLWWVGFLCTALSAQACQKGAQAPCQAE